MSAAGEPAAGDPVDELLDVLDLERIEVDVFRGRSPREERQRVFGGQVAGQALVAAGRTVSSDRPVHSLHAYFLRPGDPSVPILYEVDRIRDGRSFTTRRVVAIQHGRAIFNLAASFHVGEFSIEHQTPMPPVPDPLTLPTLPERLAPVLDLLPPQWRRPRPIDVRYVDDPPWLASDVGAQPPRVRVWLRTAGALPDEPLLHVCALTYASDMTLLDAVRAPHGPSWGRPTLNIASLDHAMWFHRPFRADQWLLYDQESPVAAGGRGLGRGQIFTREGVLVASVTQEGLFRAPAAEGG